jgi:hypothetical protein
MSKLGVHLLLAFLLTSISGRVVVVTPDGSIELSGMCAETIVSTTL